MKEYVYSDYRAGSTTRITASDMEAADEEYLKLTGNDPRRNGISLLIRDPSGYVIGIKHK